MTLGQSNFGPKLKTVVHWSCSHSKRKLANNRQKGPRWPKMACTSGKWHPKPSPSEFCSSCNRFEWSHDQFTTILSLGKNRPKMAKVAYSDQKWPEYLKNDWNWLIWCCHSYYRPILSAFASFIQQWGWTSQKSRFYTVKNIWWKAATDHISSFSFTQNAKFLKTKAKLEDMFFFLKKWAFVLAHFWTYWANFCCFWAIFGQIIEIRT